MDRTPPHISQKVSTLYFEDQQEVLYPKGFSFPLEPSSLPPQNRAPHSRHFFSLLQLFPLFILHFLSFLINYLCPIFHHPHSIFPQFILIIFLRLISFSSSFFSTLPFIPASFFLLHLSYNNRGIIFHMSSISLSFTTNILGCIQ